MASTSPLVKLQTAITLPGFPAIAIVLAMTTNELGCSGPAVVILLIVTLLRCLLGTNSLKKNTNSRGEEHDSTSIVKSGLCCVLRNDHFVLLSRKTLIDAVQSLSLGGCCREAG